MRNNRTTRPGVPVQRTLPGAVAPGDGGLPSVCRLLSAQGQGMLM